MSSPNKVTLLTLISTMQRKVEPNKLYDTLTRINSDLGKVYDTLFDGPLPAIDGSGLTSIRSESLTGPLRVFNNCPVIPIMAIADMPPSGQTSMDGIILIDSDTNSIVFYCNGLRFAAAGVAF